jgi:hypothetical protein
MSEEGKYINKYNMVFEKDSHPVFISDAVIEVNIKSDFNHLAKNLRFHSKKK